MISSLATNILAVKVLPEDNFDNPTPENDIKIPEKSIKDVIIIPPTKLKYNVGEKLDLNGFSITIIYTNARQ
jgi:hypothetical protein